MLVGLCKSIYLALLWVSRGKGGDFFQFSTIPPNSPCPAVRRDGCLPNRSVFDNYGQTGSRLFLI